MLNPLVGNDNVALQDVSDSNSCYEDHHTVSQGRPEDASGAQKLLGMESQMHDFDAMDKDGFDA